MASSISGPVYDPERTGDGHDHERNLLFGTKDQRVKALGEVDRATVPLIKRYHDAVLDCINGTNPLTYRKDKKESIDPPGPWASGLRVLLAKKLDLKNYNNVEIFSALGTSLDFDHGTDCLIRFTHPTTRKTYDVSLDFTLKLNKKKMKADVLVTQLGAQVNPMYLTPGIELTDAQTAEMQKSRRETPDEMRHEAVAETILEVLNEKYPEANRLKEILPSMRKSDAQLYGRGLSGRPLPPELLEDDEPSGNQRRHYGRTG